MRALPLLFYFAVFSIPFGTRKLLYQFTPGFHEYEAAFLYATDIIGLCFVVSAVLSRLTTPRHSEAPAEESPRFFPHRYGVRMTMTQFQNSARFFLVAFLLIVFISVFFAASKGLALYSFARLFTAMAFATAVAYVLRRGIVQLRYIFGILAASAIFQSLVAFAQFAKQGSVGLWFLGEPSLSATAPGIAKFTVEGGKILRAYGTFPHPNVLGAFLVLGLLSCVYLWFVSPRHSEALVRILPAGRQESSRFFTSFRMTLMRPMIAAGIFLVLLGLVLTFSRSAWLVAVIASTALLLYCFLRRELRRRVMLLAFTLVASGYTLVAILSPLIFPRAQISATEPSVTQRLEYNSLGFSLIRQHPLGVGVGNQVLYGVRNGLYQKLGMTEVWQWEPIHNIYLLIVSEIGIVGGLSFVLFFALLLISNIKYQISKFGFRHFIWNLKFGISVTMFLSLLAFGLVDHFLWTLRPGQLMLWLVIGMLWGACDEFRQKEDSNV